MSASDGRRTYVKQDYTPTPTLDHELTGSNEVVKHSLKLLASSVPVAKEQVETNGSYTFY